MIWRQPAKKLMNLFFFLWSSMVSVGMKANSSASTRSVGRRHSFIRLVLKCWRIYKVAPRHQ
eukprot:15052051-Ditylum_brightwellii.AAC.1